MVPLPLVKREEAPWLASLGLVLLDLDPGVLLLAGGKVRAAFLEAGLLWGA